MKEGLHYSSILDNQGVSETQKCGCFAQRTRKSVLVPSWVDNSSRAHPHRGREGDTERKTTDRLDVEKPVSHKSSLSWADPVAV